MGRAVELFKELSEYKSSTDPVEARRIMADALRELITRVEELEQAAFDVDEVVPSEDVEVIPE